MTTVNWVKRLLEFSLKHDETIEEMRISVQSVVTRLNLSPLEPLEYKKAKTENGR